MEMTQSTSVSSLSWKELGAVAMDGEVNVSQ